MPVLWEIDPTSEDATNVSVVLTDTTIRLLEMDLTPPEVEPMYSASVDTEGDPYIASRHKNRTVSLTLLAKGTTDALTQTAVYGVQQKVDKLRREGGTLKFTSLAGTVLVGDVLFARFAPELTKELYVLNKAVKFTLDFECKPYFRAAPVTLSDHVETTLPVLVFTETGITGDVPALGKLIIDNDQAVNQGWVVWGLQSRYYDASASAALFYEAESRTALGGSTTVAGPSGASGAGSNVMRNAALATVPLAVLSTQASGGGAHLSHVGDFRVFARVQAPTTNTGAVSVAMEWGQGDYRTATRNAATTLPVDDYDGTWRLVDLGDVHLSAVAQGTQRWEARILASSTVPGDDIDVDYMFLVPTAENSGEASGVFNVPAITVVSARDEFSQTAGALTAKTLPVGGVWVEGTGGSATDFAVNGTGLVTRTTNADNIFGLLGRYAIAGATPFTNALVQVDTTTTATLNVARGVVARFVDINNWLMASISAAGGVWRLSVRKRVAGTVTSLASVTIPSILVNVWTTVRLTADVDGRWYAWVVATGGTFGVPTAQGTDTVLATAGALASGTSGFYDTLAGGGVGTATRTYDNFLASTNVPSDAAMFASQSLEVRHDRVIREDSGGTLWQPPSSYEGDYLLVPPAGKEGRTVRFIVKDSRNDVFAGADTGIDDISARLTVTPRHLVLGT